MKLTYDEHNKTVWMFVAEDELREIAAAVQKRLAEATKWNDSLTVFNKGIDNSEMIFRLSADQRVWE